MLNLSMVTFVIGLSGDEKNLVSLHHLLVPMALLADLCMELLPKSHCLRLITFQKRNFMKAVAITAGCRIRVSLHDRFSMDALCITIIGMTGRAFLDDPDLIPFPWGHLVYVLMAVLTLYVIDEMSARIMFCPFLLMTSMTGDGLGMNFSPLCLHVRFDICDIPVATVAGVGSMNGLGKLPFTDFLVAAKTLGIVNAFITVFPTFDDEFFYLFPGFRRFGYLGRSGPLFFRSGFCGPQHP
jgi:hypothetical protein